MPSDFPGSPADTITPGQGGARPAADEPRGDSPTQSALARIAVRAASVPTQRVSGVLYGAADAIDELAESGPLAQSEALRDYAASASGTLRDVAERADPEEAGRLIASLQDAAKRHPVAAAGIGAAIGAVLGMALSRLGQAGDASQAGDDAERRGDDANAPGEDAGRAGLTTRA